jgi:P-type Cu2+ transporter
MLKTDEVRLADCKQKRFPSVYFFMRNLAAKLEKSKQLVPQKQAMTAHDNCQIVHTIPGRVRFRVPQLAENDQYADRLQQLLESDNWVTKVRVNRQAASIAISYQLGCSDRHMQAYLMRLIEDASISCGEATVSSSHLNTKTVEESDDSGVKLPAFAATLALLGLGFPSPRIIIASAVAIAALPIAKRAYISIKKQQKLNIDCLDFLAIALTSAQGNLLTPALVMTLHEIGDMIRSSP